MQTEMFAIADNASPATNATKASASSTLFMKSLSLSTPDLLMIVPWFTPGRELSYTERQLSARLHTFETAQCTPPLL